MSKHFKRRAILQSILGSVIALSSEIKEGSVKIIQAKDNNGNNTIDAVSRSGGQIKVLSTVCTHEGCTVAANGGNLDCPCHGSQFNAFSGGVQRGLAGIALAVFRSLEEGGEIILLK